MTKKKKKATCRRDLADPFASPAALPVCIFYNFTCFSTYGDNCHTHRSTHTQAHTQANTCTDNDTQTHTRALTHRHTLFSLFHTHRQ